MSANGVFRLAGTGSVYFGPGEVIGSDDAVEQDAQGETGTARILKLTWWGTVLECVLVLREKGRKELVPPA